MEPATLDWAALDRLRGIFLRGGPAPEPYWRGPGDLAAYDAKLARDHTAPCVRECRAAEAGFVTRCDARVIGELVRDLGGGRMTKDSVIYLEVGVDQLRKPGDPVAIGDVLGRVHARTAAEAEVAGDRLRTAFTFSSQPSAEMPLIVETV